MSEERLSKETIHCEAEAALQSVVSKCKREQKKRKLFHALRLFLLAALLTGAVYAGVYYIDSHIPSIIHIQPDREQTFTLGIPARAEVVSVSQAGVSNIPSDKISMDLNRGVTLKLDENTDCSLMVKLFGILPIKRIQVSSMEAGELIPIGAPIGLYVETKGIMVIGTNGFEDEQGKLCNPCKGILHSGDYIVAVNGTVMNRKDELIETIKHSEGESLELTVLRDGNYYSIPIAPIQDKDGVYHLGIWVRDNAQGLGTLTYIDGSGQFGALGHGITDVDTSTLMNMDRGTLYEAEIVRLNKGKSGEPGEMTGMIVYGENHILGSIRENSVEGIYGTCNERVLSLVRAEPVPIGYKQDIKKGAAQILCTVESDPCLYDVEITAVHMEYDKVNKGIELKVTDRRLLDTTGGIIQGMSGSPILQDGKIIGAVTHVLINDPTRGYGIFIENMIENNQ